MVLLLGQFFIFIRGGCFLSMLLTPSSDRLLSERKLCSFIRFTASAMVSYPGISLTGQGLISPPGFCPLCCLQSLYFFLQFIVKYTAIGKQIYSIGGLGSAVAEVMAECGCGIPLKRIGVNDHFGQVGTYEYLCREFGLTREHLTEEIKAGVQHTGRKSVWELAM